MREQFWVILPTIALSLGAASYGQGAWKPSINGAAVSTSARKIGGVTYLPIGDVARALDMKATVSGNTIALRPAGGTFQAANKLKGNQGEDLFSGRFGFKVVGVQRTALYNAKYTNAYNRDAVYEAKNGEEIIVVNCRLKNGTPKATEFAFTTYSGWGMNTSLTDQFDSLQPRVSRPQRHQNQRFDV